ncbi:M20 family metallopeptidase [Aquisalibacillus elongatus]|uniref:Aminobenzoyl-glutamate utilization protein B n=1 Tax=Aquisalibacillus elongatus TaxID=485577 RepID=A0A3N5C9L8_9BACI|nr:M20 family metallopeptidase [Aquisalibacillus elongatus]RPF53351.1 aminobenzoyl-glutamate utilization protein B [Aquisalibacillus elongatus]
MFHIKLIDELVENKKDLFTNMSDRVWDFAETAFKETQSANYICSKLEEEGFEVERGVAGIDTAFVGTFGSGQPVVGFLGEYDALPGLSQEKGIAEHKPITKGGNGHGCGHNLLGTGSFAAAIAVKDYMEQNGISGTVRYYGCPAEEFGDGKAFMAKEGAFDDLDFALCWHPAPINSVFQMNVLAVNQVYFRFKGRSAHAAASPHLGRSALDAVELMNIGVNYLREHIIPEARVHYAVTNTGGDAPNVVQSDAEVLYLIRAPKVSQVQNIYERVCKIAEGAALMTETELEVVFDSGSSDMVQNQTLDSVMEKNFNQLEPPKYTEDEVAFANQIRTTLSDEEKNTVWSRGLEDVALTDFVIPQNEQDSSTGSTDVADVSWIAPTTQALTTCISNGTALHSWQAVSQVGTSIGQKGMLYAGKLMAATALDVMQDSDLLQKAKDEHSQKAGKDRYISPIPDEVKPGLIE